MAVEVEVVDTIDEFEEEDMEQKEVKKENKAKTWFKKHWKGILAGALTFGAGVATGVIAKEKAFEIEYPDLGIYNLDDPDELALLESKIEEVAATDDSAE